MDFREIGAMYEALLRLAMLGAVSLILLIVAAFVGGGALAWWCWQHVSVTVQ